MLSIYQLNIIYVYFTLVPHILYNQASNAGNFAWTGIALGLIHSQIIFWFANLLLFLSLFLKNYINIFILFVCFYLYIFSFLKFNYLIGFLNERSLIKTKLKLYFKLIYKLCSYIYLIIGGIFSIPLSQYIKQFNI